MTRLIILDIRYLKNTWWVCTDLNVRNLRERFLHWSADGHQSKQQQHVQSDLQNAVSKQRQTPWRTSPYKTSFFVFAVMALKFVVFWARTDFHGSNYSFHVFRLSWLDQHRSIIFFQQFWTLEWIQTGQFSAGKNWPDPQGWRVPRSQPRSTLQSESWEYTPAKPQKENRLSMQWYQGLTLEWGSYGPALSHPRQWVNTSHPEERTSAFRSIHQVKSLG